MGDVTQWVLPKSALNWIGQTGPTRALLRRQSFRSFLLNGESMTTNYTMGDAYVYLYIILTEDLMGNGG